MFNSFIESVEDQLYTFMDNYLNESDMCLNHSDLDLSFFQLSSDYLEQNILPPSFEERFNVFETICSSKNEYFDFIKNYKELINKIETNIKVLKKARKNRFIKLIDYNTDAQSYAALLANAATKLIWLRRAGKAWRKAKGVQKRKAA